LNSAPFLFPEEAKGARRRVLIEAQDIELSREDIQSINSIAPEPTAIQSLPSTLEPMSL
jgi:hypothetical protein